ncbi:MAG: hypothetical protein NC218_02590 [Acetobacter sp.]|nr:hypothetical protein [Acetobacter sp.]
MADIIKINEFDIKDAEARRSIAEVVSSVQATNESVASANREIEKAKTAASEAAARANEAYKKAEAATGVVGDLMTEQQVLEKLKYTSAVPTPVDVGGIPAGTVFTGESVLSIIDKLLHPYVSFTLGAITLTPKAGVKEAGTNVVLTGAKVQLSQGSEGIIFVELLKDGEVIESMSGDDVTTFAEFTGLSTVISDDADISIRVTDNKGTVKTSTVAKYTFAAPYYYGTAKAGATLTGADILAMTKDLSARSQKAYSYEMNNNAAVIAYPASYGALTKVLDQNNFNVTDSFIEQQVNVTTSAGATTLYRVYVLDNNNTAAMQYVFTH